VVTWAARWNRGWCYLPYTLANLSKLQLAIRTKSNYSPLYSGLRCYVGQGQSSKQSLGLGSSADGCVRLPSLPFRRPGRREEASSRTSEIMHTWTSPQDASYETGVTEACKCKAKWPSIHLLHARHANSPSVGWQCPFSVPRARCTCCCHPNPSHGKRRPAACLRKSSVPSRGSATMP